MKDLMKKTMQQPEKTASKIVLVSPPLQWEENLRLSFQPPLNLLYLVSSLKANNKEVELIDTVSQRCSLDETVTRVISSAASIVGIPLYYASLKNAFELVSRIRVVNREIQFVAGGPCLTMEPEKMMLEGKFDFGITGEGEITLLELLEAIESHSNPENIPGLVLRNNDGIKLNPRREPIENLDSLPFLDFSILNNDFYFSYQEKMNVPKTLFLNSSRGCSYKCKYCCTPVLWPGKIRRYSPVRLIDEIKYHRQRFPYTDIGFCDDSFFADKKWLNEFIELVSPLNIKYQCIGRADQLTPEMVKQLYDSGMNYIAFGVETGSSKRQAYLRKHLNLEALVSIMKELSKYAIKTKCFFMLGFPDETIEEMLETINLAAELKKNGMTFFSIFPVTVYPGTELEKEFPNHPFNSGLDAHLPEIIRDGLSVDMTNEALFNSPYNAHLSHRELLNLITFAWQQVESASQTSIEELKSAISRSVAC
ncbi:MAG: B12-binding domain-containing radical SAM protein [Candidatus Riflebacteria bacterium]|nr:B12-binding domain-containing radical SAM protein [Candidatus Riflebacteria bacterium]